MTEFEIYVKRIDDMIGLKMRERDAMRESFQRLSGELKGLQTAKLMLEDVRNMATKTPEITNEINVSGDLKLPDWSPQNSGDMPP